MSAKNIILVFLIFSSFSQVNAVGKQVRPRPVQQSEGSILALEHFKKIIHSFETISQAQLNAASWLLQQNPFKESLPTQFVPFAQKINVPTGSKIAFFGDLHGNKKALDSCLASLQNNGFMDADLKIIDPHFYCIFLGDYVDRGPAGVEVLSTVLMLKIRNPHHVFLVRGNHEDRLLNSVYGFERELRTKFPQMTNDDLDAVFRIYEYMPVVLYLGSGERHDFIQCCHGGLEMGYNPRLLLQDVRSNIYQSLSMIERVEAVRELPSSLKQEVLKNIPAHEIHNFKPVLPTDPVTLGFLWNDFIENPKNYHSSVVDYHHGRGWVFGKKLTDYLLAKISSPQARVRAVFRAHQHHGEMLTLLEQYKGIMPLWDGLVYTFLTAPFPHLNFSSVSFGVLTTAQRYEEWQLEHIVL